MTDKRTRRQVIRAIGATGIGVGFAGCQTNTDGETSSGGQTASNGEGTATSPATNQTSTGGSSQPVATDELNLAELSPDRLVSKGPNGEEPSPRDTVALNDEEVQKIRDGNYTASIVFQFQGNTWVRLQERALRKRLGELGIEISGVHNPEFDPEKQSNMLETIATKDNVDAVISIPVDTEATKDAYQAVADAGKEIVFMDNLPVDFSREDYAGLVTADQKGMGIIAGRMLERLMGGSGKAAVIRFDVPFYVVDIREEGVLSLLNANDDIEVVETGFTNASDVFSIAQNLLTANPDLDGIWSAWNSPPAMQTAQALKQSDTDIPHTTNDLGVRNAEAIAKGEYVSGTGAQKPYDNGIVEANMLGKALLGKETPPFILTETLPVVRKNLLEGWKEVFHQEPPTELTKHFE